LINILQH